MARRQVTRTGRDLRGNITQLCNPGRKWSPRSKFAAIRDIQSGTHSYYVVTPGGSQVDVHVVEGLTGKYLRSNPDQTESNNLADLPPC